ncbi:hypothetical protein N9D31_03355 [Oligoflexaceae bacterium]|nr:hypothetical protein [Oligoflexaceae bacterium]
MNSQLGTFKKAEVLTFSALCVAFVISFFLESLLEKCLLGEAMFASLVCCHIYQSTDRVMVEAGLKWLIVAAISMTMTISGVIYLGYVLREFSEAQLLLNLPTVSSLFGVQAAFVLILVGGLAKVSFLPNLYFLGNLFEGIRKPLLGIFVVAVPATFISLYGDFTSSVISLLQDQYLEFLEVLAIATVLFASLISTTQSSSRRMLGNAIQVYVALLFYIWVRASESADSSVDMGVVIAAVSFFLGAINTVLISDKSIAVVRQTSEYNWSLKGGVWCLSIALPLLMSLLHPLLFSRHLIDMHGYLHWVVVLIAGLSLIRISLQGFLQSDSKLSLSTSAIAVFLIVLQAFVLLFPETTSDWFLLFSLSNFGG